MVLFGLYSKAVIFIRIFCQSSFFLLFITKANCSRQFLKIITINEVCSLISWIVLNTNRWIGPHNSRILLCVNKHSADYVTIFAMNDYLFELQLFIVRFDFSSESSTGISRSNSDSILGKLSFTTIGPCIQSATTTMHIMSSPSHSDQVPKIKSWKSTTMNSWLYGNQWNISQEFWVVLRTTSTKHRTDCKSYILIPPTHNQFILHFLRITQFPWLINLLYLSLFEFRIFSIDREV